MSNDMLIIVIENEIIIFFPPTNIYLHYLCLPISYLSVLSFNSVFFFYSIKKKKKTPCFFIGRTPCLLD